MLGSAGAYSDWYEIVTGSDIEQGNIISGCPVFMIENAQISHDSSEVGGADIPITILIYDVVIMTQSCDLQKNQGRPKVQHVVLCPIQDKAAIDGNKEHVLNNKGVLKKAAKGEHPAFFVIADYADADHPSQARDVGVVHFQQVYTVPVNFIRAQAEVKDPRLRLRSPYREALSSRFAAFFGRIALKNPVQI